MILNMTAAAAVGMMLICAVIDGIKKKIFVSHSIIFMILNGSMSFLSQNDWKIVLSGAAVGIFLAAVSLVTGEALGKGDAFLVLGSGLYLGFLENLMMVFGALLLSSVYGVILFISKKNWKQEIPFTPFLMVPYTLLVAGHLL